jgi:hypothetical protein
VEQQLNLEPVDPTGSGADSEVRSNSHLPPFSAALADITNTDESPQYGVITELMGQVSDAFSDAILPLAEELEISLDGSGVRLEVDAYMLFHLYVALSTAGHNREVRESLCVAAENLVYERHEGSLITEHAFQDIIRARVDEYVKSYNHNLNVLNQEEFPGLKKLSQYILAVDSADYKLDHAGVVMDIRKSFKFEGFLKEVASSCVLSFYNVLLKVFYESDDIRSFEKGELFEKLKSDFQLETSKD